MMTVVVIIVVVVHAVVVMTASAVLVTPSHGSTANSQEATDGRDRRCCSSIAKTFFNEAITNLPGKYTRVVAAVLLHPLLHLVRHDPRL